MEIDCVSKKKLNTYEKIVRTAKDLHRTHMICESSQNAIFEALEEASRLFDFKAEPCVCVTTQAMRVAHNALPILEEIKRRFGLNFKIISGETEAYLTSLAIEYALKREGLNEKTYVLFDLGGGSTEFVFCKNGKKVTQSFPFGIVSVAEQYKDNIEQNVTHVVESIETFLKDIPLIQKNYLQLVTTAGTPTTVAAFLEGLDYAHYDASVVNGKVLHVNDFEKAYQQLSSLNEADAERYTGTNRRDLVVVGILIVKAIMKKLGFVHCVVIDDGLREGVALAHCDASSKEKEILIHQNKRHLGHMLQEV